MRPSEQNKSQPAPKQEFQLEFFFSFFFSSENIQTEEKGKWWNKEKVKNINKMREENFLMLYAICTLHVAIYQVARPPE